MLKRFFTAAMVRRHPVRPPSARHGPDLLTSRAAKLSRLNSTIDRACLLASRGAHDQPRPEEPQFIYSFLRAVPRNPPVADQGQIQLDCFGSSSPSNRGRLALGRGEQDVFESIAAVKKRFNIDDNAHHPARFLPGRGRRVAHLAASSGPLRRG